MANNNNQPFESICIEGGLISVKVLQDLRQYELEGAKQEADYGIEKGLRFNDEIARFWRITQTRWQEYRKQTERQDIDQHTLTLNEWLIPFFERVLDYRLQAIQPIRLGEREFPMTHTAIDGAMPLVLCDASYPLDKSAERFGQEGSKRSPTGLAQEYLNAETKCLWAIVSNGQFLRIVRDNPAMTRPAYIEIDLSRLFAEDNYTDFATLWLLLHASRLAPQDERVDLCWLERWREKGQVEGERALDRLRYGVADALRQLGTGFVQQPDNQALRDKLNSGELTVEEYFQQVLTLVYRLLFLLTAEDRDVALYPKNTEDEARQLARARYLEGYSVGLLRNKARLLRHYDKYNDSWQMLCINFKGFAEGQAILAQPALGGLFAADQCPDLESSSIANRFLLTAVFKLAYFKSKGILQRINYRDMDTEEFGSVYESLLELVPQISQMAKNGGWAFSFMGDDPEEAKAGGHSRKLSGSYYTPDSLVQELIKSALEPVLEDRLAANPADPKSALLSIKICDPACGSGHFLLAAARRLAKTLADLNAGTDQATDDDYRSALREVVRHCIFGVDLNPMAVELCKTGLWLESIEPGKPLSFLDAHIQQGNALVGVLDPALLTEGIPQKAYDALTDDDKKVCTMLKELNLIEAKKIVTSTSMIPQVVASIDDMPENTVEEVAAKQQAFKEYQSGSNVNQERLKYNVFTAAFFAKKVKENCQEVPVNSHLRSVCEGDAIDVAVESYVNELAETHHFFHWPLAFPQVFHQDDRGFDVMLGNPPWERIKLQEKEYFATKAPAIAEAKNTAARAKMINQLAESTNPAEARLYQRFLIAKKGAESASAFARLSGRFPLAGRGDVNLYAIFAEHFAKAISEVGRSGVIVPTGIATDDSTKFFFSWLATNEKLVSLFDFENREALFEGVHRSYKFCALTTGSNIPQADLAFFMTQTQQLQDDRRHFSLTADDFSLINPNTQTCPVFRTKKDAELTKKLYRQAPVLIKEGKDAQNPWQIRFLRLFDMSNDSHWFQTYDDAQAPDEDLLPLYEAKMIHHYDHHWATFEADGETTRDCTLDEKQAIEYTSLPRYWVPEKEVLLRTGNLPKPLLDAARESDDEKLNRYLVLWLCGWIQMIPEGKTPRREELIQRLIAKGKENPDLLADDFQKEYAIGLKLNEQHPLRDNEAIVLWDAFAEKKDAIAAFWQMLKEERCPKFLLGWRDVTNVTNERTVISSFFDYSGVGHTMPLIFSSQKPSMLALLYSNLNTLPYDFIARQKVGGVHLTYGYFKQFPTLSPNQYNQDDMTFIIPRVLELTYTHLDIKPFAEALGYYDVPFDFDEDRRHQLKCELDAYYAKLYQLTRDELRYILDPQDVMGEDYPSETFRVLKKNEITKFGEYRTQRLVLEAFDNLQSGGIPPTQQDKAIMDGVESIESSRKKIVEK